MQCVIRWFRSLFGRAAYNEVEPVRTVEAIVLGSAEELRTIRTYFRGCNCVSEEQTSIKYSFASIESALAFIESSKQVIRDYYAERGELQSISMFHVDLYDTYHFDTLDAAKSYYENELGGDGVLFLGRDEGSLADGDGDERSDGDEGSLADDERIR